MNINELENDLPSYDSFALTLCGSCIDSCGREIVERKKVVVFVIEAMWKLKLSSLDTNEEGCVDSVNDHIGRQFWVFDPNLGTEGGDYEEYRRDVEEARCRFTENRFRTRHSSDILMRLQVKIRSSFRSNCRQSPVPKKEHYFFIYLVQFVRRWSQILSSWRHAKIHSIDDLVIIQNQLWAVRSLLSSANLNNIIGKLVLAFNLVYQLSKPPNSNRIN